MHSSHVVKRLRNPHPAREYGDIGDEADIPHKLVAFTPWVATEHLQLSLIWGEAENRAERGAFASSVRADESEDTAFFHTQIDTVQRNVCAEGLAQAVSFDHCHFFGSFFSETFDDRPFPEASRSSFAFRPSR